MATSIPSNMRNLPTIGGRPAAPSMEEVMIQLENGLDAALSKGVAWHATIKAYRIIRDELVELGMPKACVRVVLPKIKVGVSDRFLENSKSTELLKKFANIVYNLYKVLEEAFAEDALDMLCSLVEERISLIVPVD